MLRVGYVVSERVLSAVTPKDEGRSSGDTLQNNFHRGGTKERISQQHTVERVPEESTCLLTLALSVYPATCLLIAVVQMGKDPASSESHLQSRRPYFFTLMIILVQSIVP